MIRRSFHLYVLVITLTFLLFFSSYELIGLLNKGTTLLNTTVLTASEQGKRITPSIKVLKVNHTIPVNKKIATQVEQSLLRERKLYFTFDDGPTKHTEKILDTLLANEVKATFFLLKNNIDKYPEIVQRIAREGHSIGCHGVTHDVAKFYATPHSALNEMKSCNESLATATGTTSNLIRVPFGSYPYLKESHRELITQAGFIMWDWNVDSEDWTSKTPIEVIKSVEAQVIRLNEKNIAPVILLHDKKVTSEALEPIIELLSAQEYRFSTITEDLIPLQFRPIN